MRRSRQERVQQPPRPKWIVPAIIGGAVFLVCALIVVLVVSSMMGRAAERRKLESKRAGTEAALKFAEQCKTIIPEFLAFKKANPDKNWTPKRIDIKTLGIEGMTVEDAMILNGTTLVASSSELPQGLKGYKEPSPDPRVEVVRGEYRAGNVSIPCLQYKVTVEVPGSLERATARLVVRLSE